jgi:hypothetical protein
MESTGAELYSPSRRTGPALRSLRVIPLCCVTFLLMSGLARAHHSAAMYDEKKTVTVAGTVSKFEWSNPHVYIYLSELGESGQTIEWEVECSPPSILGHLGWSASSLHRGDQITVTGRPSRDLQKKSLLPDLIMFGDIKLFERKSELAQLASAGSAPSTASKPTDLMGVWVTQLSLKVEKALDGDALPLTPKGKAAYKHFDEKTMHPGTQCVPTPAPFLMVTPDLKRITRGAGVILIDGEFDNAQRTIHMGLTSHEGAVPSIHGHSIGHWDGGSLYIDTTLFAPHAMGNGYGVPSGAAKHLTESLTPDADGTTLNYHFLLTDSEFLAHSVQGDVQWDYRPNLTYAPPKCDPENAKKAFAH